MFWVISVYFNLRNTLPKFGTFLLGHPVYICVCVCVCVCTHTHTQMTTMMIKQISIHDVSNANCWEEWLQSDMLFFLWFSFVRSKIVTKRASWYHSPDIINFWIPCNDYSYNSITQIQPTKKIHIFCCVPLSPFWYVPGPMCSATYNNNWQKEVLTFTFHLCTGHSWW